MGDVNDFQRFRRKHERELEKLQAADIADRDREQIRKYIDRNTGDLKLSSLGEYCKLLRKSATRADVPLVEFDEDDFWAFRRHLTTCPDYGQGAGGLSERTVHNYAVAVRNFLQFLGREWADDLELTQPDEAEVDPSDMLGPEDVAALREAATTNRDIALVEFLADTGARLGLVGSLRVQDVTLDGDQPTFQPNPNATGLKGAPMQPYPIIDSKGALRTYKRHTHPAPEDPDAAFFHQIRSYNGRGSDGSGALTPSHIRTVLRKLADEAGLDKPTNPHNFRHSAITRMYQSGFSKQQIQHRVAWDLDTDMWSRYVHVHAEEMNEAIFEDAGIVDPDPSTPRRQQCPNCREPVPASRAYCPTCAEPTTQDARQTLQRAIKDLAATMESVESTEGRHEVGELLHAAMDDPTWMAPDHAESSSESR